MPSVLSLSWRRSKFHYQKICPPGSTRTSQPAASHWAQQGRDFESRNTIFVRSGPSGQVCMDLTGGVRRQGRAVSSYCIHIQRPSTLCPSTQRRPVARTRQRVRACRAGRHRRKVVSQDAVNFNDRGCCAQAVQSAWSIHIVRRSCKGIGSSPARAFWTLSKDYGARTGGTFEKMVSVLLAFAVAWAVVLCGLFGNGR